jgi:hypothetical protein
MSAIDLIVWMLIKRPAHKEEEEEQQQHLCADDKAYDGRRHGGGGTKGVLLASEGYTHRPHHKVNPRRKEQRRPAMIRR